MTGPEFFVDEENSIYFGKALLEAIKLEEKQQWIGCSLCDSVTDIVGRYFAKQTFKPMFIPHTKMLDVVTGHTINSYEVPMRDDIRVKKYIINWYGPLVGRISVNDHFFDSELTGTPSIDIKYHNTLSYLKAWEETANYFFKNGKFLRNRG